MDDGHTIADLLHLVQDMAGKEDGLSIIVDQTADELAHLCDPRWIKPTCRLIENQQVGVAQERGGQGEPLLHPG